MAVKVAVLSDIHGNSWALQTVLADIKNKHIATIVNLGDSLYGPLDPVGTFQILIQENIISILGNEDRILTENRKNDCRDQTREFVLNQLDSDALAWLKNRKKTLTLGDLFLCHGTPSSDTTYLMHKVVQGKLITKENDEIEKDLEKVDGKIVLCGHSHIPKILSTCSGKLVINPGSVGCPAFKEDFPMQHAVETGNPYANYTILTNQNDQYITEQIYLPYDWDKASERAKKNNRNDWAQWLNHGRV